MTQDDDPEPEYVLAGQATQADPALEYLPPAHAVHAVDTVLPARQEVPAAHWEQTEAPAAEYWPATHCAHVADVVADVAALAVPAAH